MIQMGDNKLNVTIHGLQTVELCPSCQTESSRINGHYCRHPADLPCLGYTIQLSLTVPRFFCDNDQCDRQTFAASFPAIIGPYARRTYRLEEQQRQIGYAVSAEHGARLLPSLGSVASPDTLIRLVRNTPEPETETPQVLGVDDWARRKGQTYGTILVDLEKHRVIDLYDDRSAESLAKWLEDHPGVEIISRDRASAYANGAANGAPDAVQIADRFHLLQNLVDVLKRMLAESPSKLREAAQQVAEETQRQESIGFQPEAASMVEAKAAPQGAAEIQDVTPSSLTEAASTDEGKAIQREQPTVRELRFTEVKELQSQGLSRRAVAGHLEMDPRTVGKYFTADTCPQRPLAPQSASIVTPYLTHLLQRWQEGCHNITQLHAELAVLGFKGHYASVYRIVQRLLVDGLVSIDAVATPISIPNLSISEAAWLLLHAENRLNGIQLRLREKLRLISDEANRAFALAQSFRAMVRSRLPKQLDLWLVEARQSHIKAFENFAASLQRDYAAVKAALTYQWSNGQVEGQVNRLKLIKRMMYGRGKIDLLRKRVLGAPSPS